MNNLHKELYSASIDDIRCMFMIGLSFEDMLSRHIHDGCGTILKQLIKVSRKETERLIKVHNEKWEDDITLNFIKKTIVEGRMKADDARIMILYIEKTNNPLSDWEKQFLDDISKVTGILTARQSFALKNIYERVTGGGSRQKREIL